MKQRKERKIHDSILCTKSYEIKKFIEQNPNEAQQIKAKNLN